MKVSRIKESVFDLQLFTVSDLYNLGSETWWEAICFMHFVKKSWTAYGKLKGQVPSLTKYKIRGYIMQIPIKDKFL